MFNPHDWYWLADDGRLFSSARISLVEKEDLGFLEWCMLADQEDDESLEPPEPLHPTRWPIDGNGDQTWASLQDVLTPYGVIAAPSAVEALRQRRISELSVICERTIVSGFNSVALGEIHVYPSNLKDQINLMGSVTDSLVPGLPEDWETPFWVCGPSGEWIYKMHTARQIQQAGRDGKAHVITNQTILDDLTNAVIAAETSEEIAAVSWPA